jgi:hypothetical protein
MSEDLQINKGVELMLRRSEREPERSGLKVKQTFRLLSKVFSIRLEFTWEERK